jgi:hypothetical protein
MIFERFAYASANSSGNTSIRPSDKHRLRNFQGLVLNLFQMIFRAEAFRVDFAKVFGSGRPHRKPAASGRHFEPADFRAIARRPR